MKAAIALAVMCGVAAADPTDDVAAALGAYGEQAARLHDDRARALDANYREAGCTAAIVAAHEAGIPAGRMIRARGFAAIPHAIAVAGTWSLRFRDAPAVCAEFMHWQHVADAEQLAGAEPVDATGCARIAETIAEVPGATIAWHGALASLADVHARACPARKRRSSKH